MSPGRRLNQYEVVARIGAGGMGEVFRAHDTRLGRDVALKVLHRRYADDPASRRRLQREARLVAQLKHANIGAIHGLEEADGVIFLVLELVEGVSLAERLTAGPLPVPEALDTAAQICAAVSEAHQQGILHRDLKPANVMIDDEGRVRVLDFGLATCRKPATCSGDGAAPRGIGPDEPTSEIPLAGLHTSPDVDASPESGETARSLEGTPVYMSPEQVLGEPLDRHTDVWAVGCMLFEMFTGERAFGGDSIAEAFERILRDEPRWDRLPESTPESVRRLLRRMLEKAPIRRIVELREARSLLERGAAQLRAPRAQTPPSRRGVGAAPVAASLLLSVAAMVGAVANRSSSWGAPPIGLDSIAVLPIQNLTGDPARDYFVDGMTEELTTELGRIGALKVVSRSSVRAFDGADVPLPEVAAKIGVRALIEASLLGGENLRLSVRLYDALEDVQLWGETYEASAGEIETIDSRVAQAVAVRLGIEMTEEERQLIVATRAVDPEASKAYLDGRYWAGAGRGSKSMEAYRRAVKIDPGYGAAWAALASEYVYQLPSHEYMPRARHAAQTALNLDDSLGEAHAALAQVLFFFDWDWRGADAAFQRALVLAPNSAGVRQRYAGLLWALGRLDEARAQLERARQLDPMSLFVKLELARTDYFARDYEAAADGYTELLELDPEFWWAPLFLGLAHRQAGKLDESAGALIAAHELLHEETGEALRSAYRTGGYEGLLRAWITAGEADPRVQPTSLAAQYAMLGDRDAAFERLERAFDERTRALVWIAVDPQYDPLRDDPRFQTLLRRMGLRPASG